MNGKRQMKGTRRAATRLRLTGMIVCTLALALIPAAAMAAVQEGPVVNPANGHQYYLLSPNTWTGAEAEAIAMGGHLVTINDEAENTWVWDTFAAHGPLWIGLSDAAQEGVFVWAGGEPATYFNWWGSEPNNQGGVEHYVEMNNSVWNDNSNDQSFFAVVEVGDIVIAPPAPVIVTAPPVAVNAGLLIQTDPHVDGNLVSYTGQVVGGGGEIRYFNFATNADLSIPISAGASDYLSDVSGSTVVFTRFEYAKASIWSFNTATTGPAVELAPLATSNRQAAAIGGTTVAWQDESFTTGSAGTGDLIVRSEIVAYDLGTGVPVRLTDDLLFDMSPAVAPAGNVIVWEKCATSVSSCDIWQVTSTGGVWGTASQVASTQRSRPSPDTNGILVVYGANRAGNATGLDIYWKPVAGGAESQLALAGEQLHPNISGDVIAFEGRNLADASFSWDIFLYDLSTSTMYQLTNTPLVNEALNDISVVGTQARVVWSVKETGDDYNVYSKTFAFPVADAGPGQAVHIGNVVTLDGSASSDPDANYPLSYSWTITSKPAGSAATLSNPAVVSPTFTADLPGDYVIRLVVTDSSGFVSAASSVTISTSNTAPVAYAGPDQAIMLIGTTVHLDGRESYDLEGDPLTYQWAFIEKPAGSVAVLSSAASPTPTFAADIHGTYNLSLVVSDPSVASSPDEVLVSFENVQPVADAGVNQSVVVGSTADLDGSGSSDANGDALSYNWSIAAKPEGSLAAIVNPASAQASLTPDLPGAYVVSLVVNDGLVGSDPSNVTVGATGGTGSVLSALTTAMDAINLLAPGSLKNQTMANALTNKINAAIRMIDQGLYLDALDKLQNDIIAKTDGCAKAGAPDKNDWLTNCAAQGQVYRFIIEAINLLKLL